MWMKQWIPKKRWARVLVIGGSVTLMALAADMVLVQAMRGITVSVETTRVVAPLTKRGTPDYLGVVNARLGAGIEPEENAAPLLLKIVGTDTFPESWRRGVLPALKLPASLPGEFQTFERWIEQQDGKSREPAGGWDRILEGPWRAAENPDVAAWLEKYAGALAKAREACRRPKYFVPLVTANGLPQQQEPGETVGCLMPELGAQRGLMLALLAAANRDAGEANLSGAAENLLAVGRMTRLLANQPVMIDGLVGYWGESSLWRVVGGICNSQGGGGAVQATLVPLEALPDVTSPLRSIDAGERLGHLDMVCFAATYGPAARQNFWSDWDAQRLPPITLWTQVDALLTPISYNRVARETNAYFDEVVAAMCKASYGERQQLLKELTIRRRTLLAARFVPEFPEFRYDRVDAAYQQARTMRDLARTALALRAYHGTVGRYPAKLQELMPRWLPEVPMDGFSGAAMNYRVTADGMGYVLYSVGPDGEDQAGEPYDRVTHKGDLVIRTAPVAIP